MGPQTFAVLCALISLTFAAQAPQFAPPGPGPTSPSSNYVGLSNCTLPNTPKIVGKVFDRFTQIWLENTDFEVANTTPTFQNLATQGILLSSYYAVTHPSEPNYVASLGGDFFGMGDDNLYNIPANISTAIDLLEAKDISWASYQENLPTDGSVLFSFTQPNYLDTSAPPYTYYVRKHNPHAIFNSVVNVESRRSKIRNFNDFAADLNASAIPQWNFVTPNLVNDGHDTDIDFAAAWLEYWLVPMLANPNFNDNRTLIVLTFDENENQRVNNRVFTLLLGGAVPQNLRGTVDDTYYSHYSLLSTVQANWGLGSLGRQDTNKSVPTLSKISFQSFGTNLSMTVSNLDRTMSNVFSFVADVIGYQNQVVTGSAIPITSASGENPGPLNSKLYVPFAAPNLNAIGAGGGPVFVSPVLNTSVTPDTLPPPVNLAALGQQVPSAGYANGTGPNGSVPPPVIVVDSC